MDDGEKVAKKYKEDQIYSICDYPPYRGGSNPGINVDTYKIMDLKSSSAPKHNAVVIEFGKRLNDGTKRLADSLGLDRLQVAIVPSSEKEKVSVGLESMLNHVQDVNIIYNTKYLVRNVTVPKAHLGGGRSYQRNIDSISVHVKPIPNIPLLLIDDVSTSGNSLNSCREILLNSGVKHVYMVTIGRTV